MRAATFSACLLALLALGDARWSGMGTAYSGPGDKDATGFNACGFGKLDSYFERYYGAMNSAQFNGGVCGRCVRVSGTESGASGKSFLVMIVDECPTCSHGDVDFSTTALQAITGFSWDKKGISWEWADCNGATDAHGEEQKGEPEDEEKKSSKKKEDDEEEQSADNEGTDKEEEQSTEPSDKDKSEEEPKESEDSAPPPPPKKDEPEGQPIGTYADWVVQCSKGRRRCPNLTLASQGYQCTNLAGDSCCLTGSGQGCKKLAGAEHENVQWDGALPVRRRRKPRQGRRTKPATQQPEQQQKQPADEGGVASEVAAAATDAFAAAASAAAAASSGSNRKMMLR